MVIGTGVIIGALWPRRRWHLFSVGLGLASLLTAITAVSLSQPLGVPTLPQVRALAAALVVEVALIAVLGQRYKNPENRTFNLAVMLVVGFHFIFMMIAFGPVIAWLGAASMANAAAGLWVVRRADLRALWAIDGILKAAAGAVMFFIVPV
jgi:hypothetical protein